MQCPVKQMEFQGEAVEEEGEGEEGEEGEEREKGEGERGRRRPESKKTLKE